MTTLESLPAELLYSIHLLSLSPSLPFVSTHLRALFTHSSPSHKAAYLLLRHPHSPLSHAIRYPLCTLPVIHALERLALSLDKRLRASELPKRLVRGLGTSGGDSPVDVELLEYMLETYHASPNSHKGYFLARAVLAKDLPIVRLLLKHGADPALKGGWAVNTAIGAGDLGLVKLLLEREVERAEGGEEGEERVGKGKKRKRLSDGGGGKRRKMEVRCEATAAMLECAVRAQQWPIVDYLTARGAVPNMGVLKLL